MEGGIWIDLIVCDDHVCVVHVDRMTDMTNVLPHPPTHLVPNEIVAHTYSASHSRIMVDQSMVNHTDAFIARNHTTQLLP